ncbi:MAG: hypothetical protein ABJO29_14825 [Yoonia sp.]|uniref:hypothetical protein n=1 Tax=Yoonia sp. TaxID=2212373 RepID=UPI003265FA45
MSLVVGSFPAHRREMQSDLPPKTPSLTKPAWFRALIWFAMFTGIVIGLHTFLSWSQNFIGEMNSISGTMTMAGVIAISLLIYAVLIATPFMPGIEVGIALLLLQGAAVAPFVYIATVTGLMVAYLIGRTIPLPWLRKVFCDLGLQTICTYLDRIADSNPAERLASQRKLLPRWLSRLTVDYRYATLGLLLNVPGTFAIGGGGGIMMVAGLSRLFRGWVVLITVMIATLPIPLIVWIVGVSVFEGR